MSTLTKEQKKAKVKGLKNSVKERIAYLERAFENGKFSKKTLILLKKEYKINKLKEELKKLNQKEELNDKEIESLTLLVCVLDIRPFFGNMHWLARRCPNTGKEFKISRRGEDTAGFFGPLSGRRGTASVCSACGEEIAFSGRVY